MDLSDYAKDLFVEATGEGWRHAALLALGRRLSQEEAKRLLVKLE
jgi:hypothetical protein